MYELHREDDRSPEEKRKDQVKAFFEKLFGGIQSIVLFLAFLVVLYLILVTPHQVDGKSMFPTYKDDEYLIANKMIYNLKKPERGDVVIFKYSPTKDFIKRVIAIPGDTISISNCKFYLNGELLNESEYIDSTVCTKGARALGEGNTITIPEGKYFVSGDNRQHSTDSRAFGPVEFEKIKGKVWFVFYPFSNFRFIKAPQYQ